MLNPEKYLNLVLVAIGHGKIFILPRSKLESLTTSYSRMRCLQALAAAGMSISKYTLTNIFG